MIKNCVIKIETKKFPILDGEKAEIVNENMYGQALCQYLEKELPSFDMKADGYLNEDWGWWLAIVDGDWRMDLRIYSDPDATDNPESYAIMPSIMEEKKWRWSEFRRMDVSKDVLGTMDKVEKLFLNDRDITKVTRHDGFPY